MATTKRYTLKVYDKAGTTFLGTYGQLSDYAFTSALNGGLGQLVITLPRNFDEFNNDNQVSLLNHVQLWVQDNDTSGMKVYSGYIDQIDRNITGSTESVRVVCLGYGSRLGFSLDWDGTNVVVARDSLDPTAIIKDILDKYNANYTNPFVDYNGSSTENTGLTVSYQSDSKTVLESIERVRQMAGEDWWWSVDADNVFYFKSKPMTPTHSFVMGKDISSINIKESASDISNQMLFWNGLQTTDVNFIQRLYYSATSVSAYWNRFEKLTDSRITDTTTAEKLAEGYIKTNQDPNVSITFTIKDNNLGNGYDIESVKVGDTCRILNVKDSALYSGNFQITNLAYTPEALDITVEDKRTLVGRTITDIRRGLATAVYSDGVSSVTLVDID
jgi:hypothetical protein